MFDDITGKTRLYFDIPFEIIVPESIEKVTDEAETNQLEDQLPNDVADPGSQDSTGDSKGMNMISIIDENVFECDTYTRYQVTI